MLDETIKHLTQVFPPERFATGSGIDENGHHYQFLTNINKKETGFFNELTASFDKKDEIAISNTAYRFLYKEAEVMPDHFAVFIKTEASVPGFWKHLNHAVINYKKHDRNFLLQMR